MIGYLKEIVAAGDPVFIMDLFEKDKDIIQFPFQASALMKSIDDGSSCLYQGPMPNIPPKSLIYSFIRWWTYPMLFMILCWTLLLKPAWLKTYWPI